MGKGHVAKGRRVDAWTNSVSLGRWRGERLLKCQLYQYGFSRETEPIGFIYEFLQGIGLCSYGGLNIPRCAAGKQVTQES